MAWYNSSKDLGNSIKSAGGAIFGNSKDPGALGTGKFTSKGYDVKDEAFDSPMTTVRQAQFASALKKNNARTGPMMNTAQADQFRNVQTGLVGGLQDQINGKGPSVADMQMQRGLNQSLANQNSQVQSMRGLNPALAFRAVQNNAATQNQDLVNNQAMLRAQETAQARGQLGELASGARSQDLSTASANQQSVLSQRGMNDAQDRFIREGQMTMDERQRQAQIQREQLKSSNALGRDQINSGAYNAAAQNRAGMVGGLGAGIASIISSDERAKTNIAPISFDSPSKMGAFSPASEKKPMSVAVDEDKFEPTREAAEAMKKDYSPTDTRGQSAHFKAGAGLADLGKALSDEDQKKNKKDGGKNLKGFLDALKGYTFEYKDPSNGEGEQVGVMAQDLEKHPIGKNLVIDTPEGKMVDYGKAGGLMLASQAALNERLNGIEKMFQRRKSQKGAA